MHGTREEIAVQETKIAGNMKHITNKIVVMSGKGGVGKTSTTINLACALAMEGKKVAVFDTDLHGPNIAKMLGIEKGELIQEEDGVVPVEGPAGVKAVSVSMTGANPDQPMIWRGPMKSAVIRQLLADVKWGELDYLIIDSPPGTGDEPLSVCQMIPGLTGAVIVTTPQDVAVLDARKSVMFTRQLNVPVIGIIENMSGFICPHCGKESDLFKKGGGEAAAKEMKVSFLGSIPFDPEVVKLSDEGKPVVLQPAKSRVKEAFFEIVEKIKIITNAPGNI